MESKDYPNPVLVTESGGVVNISYDHITVHIPFNGPTPEDLPDLASRLFQVMKDLRGDHRAE